MTIYNFTDGTITGAIVPPATTLCENEMVILRNILDFSKQTLTVATDTAVAINIPANTTVMTAFVRIMTVESTASATIDLGYGGNVDQWGDGLDASAAADVVLGYLNAPVFFASADTIDIISDGGVDFDTLKVEVTAICIKHVDTY